MFGQEENADLVVSEHFIEISGKMVVSAFFSHLAGLIVWELVFLTWETWALIIWVNNWMHCLLDLLWLMSDGLHWLSFYLFCSVLFLRSINHFPDEPLLTNSPISILPALVQKTGFFYSKSTRVKKEAGGVHVARQNVEGCENKMS